MKIVHFLRKRLILWCTLAVMLVFALFPIYWMLNTSFKTTREIYRMTPTFWPEQFVWTGYQKLFASGFLNNVKNSLVVAMIVTVVSIFFAMLAAYAIAKLSFRGREIISKSILYAYLMPRSIMFIPLYMLVTSAGLADSIYGLMLVYPTITVPYATWMLISYFTSIPDEIEEAAMIDGCSRFGSMFRVVFPLSAPGISATAIFSFTLCWSEYLYALVIVSKAAQKTIPLALSDMVVADVAAWGPLMAGSIVAAIPVMILYLLVSRNMVSGMTLGGIK
ncbi:MAG: carbohydrate ABC transporter permease [Symbiobacterium sp.]|uniref:carbohydrate ABC transporter permease n=1 Tax=Symbiobacterium sp. TaxID=1971213 RepID=UPI003463A545